MGSGDGAAGSTGAGRRLTPVVAAMAGATVLAAAAARRHQRRRDRAVSPGDALAGPAPDALPAAPSTDEAATALPDSPAHDTTPAPAHLAPRRFGDDDNNGDGAEVERRPAHLGRSGRAPMPVDGTAPPAHSAPTGVRTVEVDRVDRTPAGRPAPPTDDAPPAHRAPATIAPARPRHAAGNGRVDQGGDPATGVDPTSSDPTGTESERADRPNAGPMGGDTPPSGPTPSGPTPSGVPPSLPAPGPGRARSASSRRRTPLVVGGVLAVVLAVGAGVALATRDDGSSSDQVATTPLDPSTSATTAPPPVSAANAFGVAAQRLTGAGSFSYSGSVSATDISQARPMLWLAVGSTVQGQVATTTGRVHEVAAATDGSAAETVTDGPRVWGRRAPAVEALAEQPYEPIPGLSDEAQPAKGLALLPTWLAAATGATDTGADELGRRTFQAVIPADVLGVIERERAPVDATVVLTLDSDGDPARVEITSAPDGPPFQIAVDLADVGAPVAIEPPPAA